MAIEARVEPMLEAVNLSPWLDELYRGLSSAGRATVGKRSRPICEDWVRTLRDQPETTGLGLFVEKVGSDRPA